MSWRVMGTVCTKLNLSSSKNNEIEISVLEKFTLQALLQILTLKTRFHLKFLTSSKVCSF